MLVFHGDREAKPEPIERFWTFLLWAVIVLAIIGMFYGLGIYIPEAWRS